MLVAAIALEASAWVALRLLKVLSKRGLVGTHLEYLPVDRLSDQHADLIERLLAGEPTHHRLSESLGWTAREGFDTGLYAINSSGIRSRREFAEQAPADKTRILTFGDSFTFGEEVDNQSTWQTQLESLEPTLEILNFGVGGYGVDQSYLRYLERGKDFEADVVVIGFLPDNFFRHLNRFRPFLARGTGVPLSKPRFRIDTVGASERLVLVENPLPDEASYAQLLRKPRETLTRIGAGDAYYERRYKAGIFDLSASVRLAKMASARVRWHRFSRDVRFGVSSEETEAFRVTMHLFKEFVVEVKRRGDTPAIILYPPWWDLIRRRDGRQVSYATLMEQLESVGLCHIDLAPAFDSLEPNPRREDVFEVGHYSRQGNKLIAKHLQHELRRCVPQIP